MIKSIKIKIFMLLCGFEKFDSLFVRIDILERLFMLIINSPNSKENKEIKIIPEMLNLLGCSKDNFKKLLQKMHYKIFDKDDETYFKYNPVKKFKKEPIKKVSMKIHLNFKKFKPWLNLMFFKKDSTDTGENFLVKTCALLIYAAKIDENLY
jgi:hypothetical protein